MVEAYIPSLTKNALKFTKNLDDAYDLVQDTMVKAIRFYEKYESDTNLTGWLFVIMRNTFINKCRKEARKRALITQGDEISSAHLLYSAEENSSTGKMIMDDVKNAIEAVPEVYRVPFLRYVEGFKYHEIAEQQGIPLGTVKTHIHEARGLLKKQLKIYKDS